MQGHWKSRHTLCRQAGSDSLYTCARHSNGLHSHGLYGHGLCTYGLYSCTAKQAAIRSVAWGEDVKSVEDVYEIAEPVLLTGMEDLVKDAVSAFGVIAPLQEQLLLSFVLYFVLSFFLFLFLFFSRGGSSLYIFVKTCRMR